MKKTFMSQKFGFESSSKIALATFMKKAIYTYYIEYILT